MSIFGYDRGAGVSLEQAKSLSTYSAGKFKNFFMRYLAPSDSWKYFSPEEAKRLSDAGYMIGTVFQEGTTGLKEGKNGGIAAATKAKIRAGVVGQPKKSAIFFAVDYDAPEEDYDKFEEFLKAAQEVLGTDYFVGVYGKYDVIEEMAKRNACKYFWQTVAWSENKLSTHADLYQYKIDTLVNGINVDFNECFNTDIFWGQYKESENITPTPIKTLEMYIDVPVNHWAVEAIKKAYNKNVMTGVSKNTFGLGVEVTREQLAVVVYKLGLLIDKPATRSVPIFSDVPTTHWAYDAIKSIAITGIMTGLGNGTFGVGKYLTREQFAQVLKNLGLTNIGENYWKVSDIYKDVPSDFWAAEAIQNAYLKGVIVGNGDGKFGLGESVMREQLAKVFDNMNLLD